ncbi:MAG: tRNA pseudouridine(38-40) synthase TruA [Bacteroidales bacterium]|nr:tRNA pseudouridine(38-40) synthase TruA [Bacteroidales bacterium]
MKRYFIFLSYNGANYHGWQIQPKDSSVQQTIEEKLSMILREKITVTGAGRTDTGVNASLMVAHFDIEKEIEDVDLLADRLNRVLPKDIAIEKIVAVKDDAHARFSALARTYKYYVTSKKDPFGGDFKYRLRGEIDVDKMNQAASMLFDYIDFTSFSKLHTDVKTNNCKIMYAKWERIGDDDLIFTIKADRFLRNMVRAIVGTLLLVGRGKLSLDGFKNIIEQKDRCKAGDSAIAGALFLVDIEYPDSVFN